MSVVRSVGVMPTCWPAVTCICVGESLGGGTTGGWTDVHPPGGNVSDNSVSNCGCMFEPVYKIDKPNDTALNLRACKVRLLKYVNVKREARTVIILPSRALPPQR